TGPVRATGRIMPFIELGVGFQSELSGRENVYLYGSIMGLTKRQVNAKYDEIVGFAELDEFMDLPLKDYSSGMVMRLAFSTAIMTDPDILLIDEVLAVGDVAFKKKSLERMNELWNSGKTIVFVSHQADQVKQLCENSVLLSHGRITSCGPSDEVVGEYESLLRREESSRTPLHDGSKLEAGKCPAPPGVKPRGGSP
ncbi:MAG: ABC transporter ATP-binding protein, partial [Candidatus ainarchaeum sp.]|nr:ABC transporter ATP-binding protein [Candidatus ainarchaeum sp.]